MTLLLKQKVSREVFSFAVNNNKLQLTYKGKLLDDNIFTLFTNESGFRTMVDYDLNDTYVIRITKTHFITANKLHDGVYINGICNYEILEKE